MPADLWFAASFLLFIAIHRKLNLPREKLNIEAAVGVEIIHACRVVDRKFLYGVDN